MDAAFASGVMFMTICKEEKPMPSVTSKDGTIIAFDRVGSGPAVILVSGATAYRAFDSSMTHLAELLGKHFTVYNYDRRGRGDRGEARRSGRILFDASRGHSVRIHRWHEAGSSNVVRRDRRGTYSCLRRGFCRRCHAGQTAPT